MKIKRIMEKAALLGGYTSIDGKEPTDGYIVAVSTIATSELLDEKLVRILRDYIPCWGLWYDPDKKVWLYEVVKQTHEKQNAINLSYELKQKCFYNMEKGYSEYV